MNNETALAIIQKHEAEKDLVYVRPEDLQTQRMFVPQVTVLHALQTDFHERPINGKMMPKSHHVDRIGEAAGVDFVDGGTRKEGDFVYVGFAQGRRRLPDGTWRKSSVQEYEFDVDVRSKEDFLNDSKGKYTSDVAKEKHVIDLKKVARQRASTGARLRVIRELVGIPIAFGPEEFKRAMVIHRIAVNSDALLDNPETRHEAVAMATGAVSEVYGPRDVTPEPEALPEPEAVNGNLHTPVKSSAEPSNGNVFFGAGEEPSDGSPIEEARIRLEEFKLCQVIQDYKPEKGRSPVEAIDAALEDKSKTLEDLQNLIDRCLVVLQAADKKAGVI